MESPRSIAPIFAANGASPRIAWFTTRVKWITRTRNFSFVADVVDALCRLLECKEAEGEIFNIGGTEEVPIGKLAEHVKAMAESRSPIVTVPYHQAYPETGFEDMRRRAPCLCKIRQMTAWQPVTPVRQMIQETLSWERRRLERVSTELLRNAG